MLAAWIEGIEGTGRSKERLLISGILQVESELIELLGYRHGLPFWKKGRRTPKTEL